MKIVFFAIWSNQRTLWSDVITVLCRRVSVLVLFTKVCHNMTIWDCQKTNSYNQLSIHWVIKSWPSGCLSLLFPIWQKSRNSICWWVPGSIFHSNSINVQCSWVTNIIDQIFQWFAKLESLGRRFGAELFVDIFKRSYCSWTTHIDLLFSLSLAVGKYFMSQRICTNHATRTEAWTSHIDCVLSASQLHPELVITVFELQLRQILIVYYLHQLRLINSPSEG